MSYLQTDAPLYYYASTDAFIAMAYRSLKPADQRRRSSPMTTTPSRSDTTMTGRNGACNGVMLCHGPSPELIEPLSPVSSHARVQRCARASVCARSPTLDQ